MINSKVERLRAWGVRGNQLGWIFALFLMVVGGFCGNAFAFEIKTKNDDFNIRWDNSVKYNYGVRLEDPDNDIMNSANYDDGNRNFDEGTVTNRIDILSELDIVYKEDFGFRVSGAFWYDQRYSDPMGNDSPETSNYLDNGVPSLGLSPRIKDECRGLDGELLDAFLFGKIDLGDVPVRFRLGRHTLYWGEAWLFGGLINGISYGQFPIDVGKAYAVPGAEAKELFRPRFAASVQAQLTNDISLSFQQFFEYDPVRFRGNGSFLGCFDMLHKGADAMYLAPGVYATRSSDNEPDKMSDWGASAQWTPAWMKGGRLGLYYRNFSDIQPQVVLDLEANEYFLSYADDIQLFGVSFSKEIMGVAVSMEYNYRNNMQLNSGAGVITSSSDRPSEGEVLGTRGDTHHALINFFGFLDKTPLFDTATYIVEFNYNRWQKVTQGEELFLGRSGYNEMDRVSKDAWGGSLSFTPTWFQRIPGIDISMPISACMGLGGNSAVAGGDARGAGNASVALAFDVYNKYNFSVAYNTYYGDFEANDNGVTYYRGSGGLPLLSDRDWISLTFKTNF